MSEKTIEQLEQERYNVIGCAGGDHCVCMDGWGHKKYNAQTPIPVPLADKSKEELVRIIEMMQEDLRWYVDERNRLLAAQSQPSSLDRNWTVEAGALATNSLPEALREIEKGESK
jgi:hypothetical protein